MDASNEDISDNNRNDDDPDHQSKHKPIQVSKQEKRGIIYLSYIPDGLNVNKLRQILTEFGEIDRIFLEPNRSHKTHKTRKTKSTSWIRYVEGWVEFKKKRVAKTVARVLNGRQIGGKRRNKFRDAIWSIKYLPKFKWTHLAEQMNYEKQLRDQRLRFEISRAKQETNFYSSLIERSIVHNKRRNKLKDVSERSDANSDQPSNYKERRTQQSFKRNENSNDNNNDQIDIGLLNQIFN